MTKPAEVVVIGSGIAGLTAALAAASVARVVLVTKGSLANGSTYFAQGGLAAALGSDDAPERHVADTIAAGRGLCNPEAVEVLCHGAPAAVQRMSAWGVAFDSDEDGLRLGREAAHSHNRIVHAHGDATGREIEMALIKRVLGSGIEIREQSTGLRLLLESGGRCVGVLVRNGQGNDEALYAGATILATGGAGQLWSHTTNPAAVCGDGLALAWEAGAEMESMEFMQFHPTTLAVSSATSSHFLLTEALRGEGAMVVNRDQERFLFAADERGELAPRDVVAQAIWKEMERSGEVFLDCRPLGAKSKERFPTVYTQLQSLGMNLDQDLIPITPAAHYLIGGVKVDADGRSTVPGLFACGEVACSGVHGANRLASNSLLEGAVFGYRCGEAAVEFAAENMHSEELAGIASGQGGEENSDARYMAELRQSMWSNLGIVRDAKGISSSLALAQELCEYSQASVSQLHRASITAWLVCQSALQRQESRGTHFRSDFPETNPGWQKTVVLKRG